MGCPERNSAQEKQGLGEKIARRDRTSRERIKNSVLVPLRSQGNRIHPVIILCEKSLFGPFDVSWARGHAPSKRP